VEFEEAAAAADAEAAPQDTAEEVATPDLAENSQEVETAEPEASPPGQLFPVTINGEVYEVSLEEALQGYQRQADYTRKTQELAEQREELSYAERIAEALESDPERTIRALEAAYGLEGAKQVVAEAQEPSEPVDPEEARIGRIESFIEAQEMRAFEAQVKAELADVREMFSVKFDDTEVLAYAAEHGIPSATEAAKAFLVDRIASQAKRQQADRQAQNAKSTAPPVAGGHGVAGGAVQSGGVVPPTTIDAAFDLAAASLGLDLD
jgi:hypothetical protein